jgi:hypothetical protein
VTKYRELGGWKVCDEMPSSYVIVARLAVCRRGGVAP